MLRLNSQADILTSVIGVIVDIMCAIVHFRFVPLADMSDLSNSYPNRSITVLKTRPVDLIMSLHIGRITIPDQASRACISLVATPLMETGLERISLLQTIGW